MLALSIIKYKSLKNTELNYVKEINNKFVEIKNNRSTYLVLHTGYENIKTKFFEGYKVAF